MTPDQPPPQKRPYDAPTSMQLLGQVWAISFAFVASAAAGALLGWGADALLHSKPIGILAGAGVGIVAGAIRFVRDAKRAEALAQEPPQGPDR